MAWHGMKPEQERPLTNEFGDGSAHPHSLLKQLGDTLRETRKSFGLEIERHQRSIAQRDEEIDRLREENDALSRAYVALMDLNRSLLTRNRKLTEKGTLRESFPYEAPGQRSGREKLNGEDAPQRGDACEALDPTLAHGG